MASAYKLYVVSTEERVEDPVAATTVPSDAPSAAGTHTVEWMHAGTMTEEEMEGREGKAGLSLGPWSFTELSCLEESQFNGSPPGRSLSLDVVLAPT